MAMEKSRSPPSPALEESGIDSKMEFSLHAKLTDAVCNVTSIFTPSNLGGFYGATQPQRQRIFHEHKETRSGLSLNHNDDGCPATNSDGGYLAPCSCRFTLTSSTIKPMLRTFGLYAGTIMVECAHREQPQSAESPDPQASKWEEVPALLLVMQHSVFIAQVMPTNYIGSAGPLHDLGVSGPTVPGPGGAGQKVRSSSKTREIGSENCAVTYSLGDGRHPKKMSLHSFPVPFCESCSKSQQHFKQVIACSKSGSANVLRTFQLPSLYEALRSHTSPNLEKPRNLNSPQETGSNLDTVEISSSALYVSHDVLLAGWLHKWPMRSQYFGSRTRRFFALVAPLQNSSLPSMLLYWKSPPSGFFIQNESASNIATCETDIQINPSTCRGRFLVSYKCVLSRKKSSLYGESIIVLKNDVDELEIACLSETEDAKWYRALCELLFVERNSRELKLYSKVDFPCGTYERVKTAGAARKKRTENRKQQLDDYAGVVAKHNEIDSVPCAGQIFSEFHFSTDPPVTIFDPAFLSIREMSNAAVLDSKLNPNCAMKSTQIILRDVCADVSSTNFSVCFARIELAKNELGSKRVESSQGGCSVHVKNPGESLSASLDSSSELTVATTALDEGSTSDRTSAFQFRRRVDPFGRVNMIPAVSIDSSMEIFDSSKEERPASVPSNYGNPVKVESLEFRKSPLFSGIRSKLCAMPPMGNNDWARSPNSSFCCALFSTEELGLSRGLTNRAFYVQISRGDRQVSLHKLVGPSSDDCLKADTGGDLGSLCMQSIDPDVPVGVIACGDNCGAIRVGFTSLTDDIDIEASYLNSPYERYKDNATFSSGRSIFINKLSNDRFSEKCLPSTENVHPCPNYRRLYGSKPSGNSIFESRPVTGHSFDSTITSIAMSPIESGLLEPCAQDCSYCRVIDHSSGSSNVPFYRALNNRYLCLVLLSGDDSGSLVIWKLNLLISCCDQPEMTKVVDIKWSSEPLQRCDFNSTVQCVKYCPQSENFVVLTSSQVFIYEFCDSVGDRTALRADIMNAQVSAIIEHGCLSKYRLHHLGALDVTSDVGFVRLWRISDPSEESNTSSTTGLRSHISFSEFAISDLELRQRKLLERVANRLFEAATFIASSTNVGFHIQNRIGTSAIHYDSLICSVATGFGVEKLLSNYLSSEFNICDSTTGCNHLDGHQQSVAMEKWSFADFEEYVRLRNRIRKWWKENSSRVLILHEKIRLDNNATDTIIAARKNNVFDDSSADTDEKMDYTLGAGSVLRMPRKLVIPPSGTCGGHTSPAFTHSLPARYAHFVDGEANTDVGSDYWKYKISDFASNTFDPYDSYAGVLKHIRQGSTLSIKRELKLSGNRYSTIETISPLFAAAVAKEFCGHVIIKCVLQTVDNNPFLQALHGTDEKCHKDTNVWLLCEELYSLELVCSMISQICEGFGFDYVEALKFTMQNDATDRLYCSIEESITNFFGTGKKEESLGSIFVDVLGWNIEDSVDFMNAFGLGMLEAPTEGIRVLFEIKDKLTDAIENAERGINDELLSQATLFIRWIDSVLDIIGVCRDNASGFIFPVHTEILLLPVVVHISFAAYTERITSAMSGGSDQIAKLGLKIREIAMKLLSTFIVKPLRILERPVAQDSPSSLIFALSGFDHTQSPALIKLVQGQSSINALEDFYSKAPAVHGASEENCTLESSPFLFESEKSDSATHGSHPIVPSQLRLISELIQATQPWVRFVISSRNKAEQKEK